MVIRCQAANLHAEKLTKLMTTIAIITAILIVIIGGLAWIIIGISRTAKDVMDEIMDNDRHDYKESEREAESKK